MALRGLVAHPVLALAAGAGPAPAEPAKSPTRYVRGDAAFAAAVAQFRHSGGTIVLLRGSYRQLVIGHRLLHLWIALPSGDNRHLVIRPR